MSTPDIEEAELASILVRNGLNLTPDQVRVPCCQACQFFSR